ncbi:hypothetical protein MMAG44476_20119 [Mycolicibacterium mageritense DSM 44476 = CIP 104973]|uniref:Uncharacterized protein n=1 Tax=Mycolicibacterium mageritense TaxID=53462 RepID=A0ABN5YFJ9_MYCME|nr:hypothetical protein [Mycolicibacterium mageritense]BBX35974.1 hypothetical protein MMAGJ_52560 [Mycolicibacterium mageritense]CDO24094.1 hypothetical protein BN978_04586 [Mycolicibacterium mageritense DSM 44476 = CIP 104973]
MTRSVVAVDTTVFYTSIARLVDGDPTPRCGYLHAADVTSHHAPAQEMRRHVDLAAQVVSAITKSRFGVPDLVVMVRPYLGTMTADPSAQRRVSVWWEIVRQLDVAGVPVGEVSLLSVQKSALGSAAFGKKGTDALAQWVADNWTRWTPPLYDGKPDPRYRATTLAVAAAGALAAGFPAAQLPASDDVVNALRGGMNLPAGFRLPDTAPRATGTKKRLTRDEYISERLVEIASLPITELETWKPRSPALKEALKERFAKEEDRRLEASIMGGEL